MRYFFYGIATGLLIGLILHFSPAPARDLGQWDDVNHDAATRDWFKKLMRPDMPTMPCCGEADGYYCEDIHVRQGHTFCTITDDRDDKPIGRPHIDIGTEIEIPDDKLKWDRGNPTGHAIVFLGGSAYARYVFCYVQSSGI